MTLKFSPLQLDPEIKYTQKMILDLNAKLAIDLTSTAVADPELRSGGVHQGDRETWRASEGGGVGECAPLPGGGGFGGLPFNIKGEKVTSEGGLGGLPPKKF